MKILISLLLIFSGIFLVRNVFDPGVYKPSSLEIGTTFARQEYLGKELGKIYKNRFGLVYFNNIYPAFMRFKSIFLSDLDKRIFFVPLFGFLLYLGWEKFDEK